MDWYSKWHQNLLQGSRMVDRDEINQISGNGRLLYWNIINVNDIVTIKSEDIFSGGILIECYQKKDTNELIILLATYVAPNGAYFSTTLREIKYIKNISKQTTHATQFDVLLYGIHNIHVQIQYNIDQIKLQWSLESIEIVPFHSNNIILNHDETIQKTITNKYTSVENRQIPCPDCYGRGERKTFAIPTSAFNQGLSGYALFQENTLNGNVACITCGGKGEQFYKWYLEENSEKTSSKDYQKGTGFILCGMPPTIVSLQ